MCRLIASIALCVLLAGPSGALYAQHTRAYLTEADRRVSAALDATTELDIENRPLTELVEHLKRRHGINIQLDDVLARDSDAAAAGPVTAHVKGASLRRALRDVLQPIGLTYTIHDGYLLITGLDTCPLVSRIYPVGDLLASNGLFCASPRECPAGPADFRKLTDLVAETVAPTSWDHVGGPACIEAIATSKALVISQEEEGHEQIVRFFTALRSTRDKQIAAAEAVIRTAPATHQQEWYVKAYRLHSAHKTHQRETSGPPQEAARNLPRRDSPESSEATNPSGADPHLTERAKDIAALLPKIVAPDSWQPTGKAAAYSLANAIVVRQTEEVHEQIADLLSAIIPDEIGPLPARNEPTLRLAVPGPQRGWPQSAEPATDEWMAALEKSFDEQVDLQFQGTPLGTAIKAVSDKHHVQVAVDHEALSDAGVTLHTPITRDLRGLTLRAALHLILHDLSLAYAFRNKALYITSIPCEEMLTYRVYPVFDLVVRPPQAPAVGPAVDFEPLVRALTTTVAPTTWDEVGGPGEITTFASAGALIISQTSQVHQEIAQFLKTLREVGAEQESK